MSAFVSLDIQPEPVANADVPFGEWLPDQPEVNNPGAIEALNVIPAEGAYVPFPQHIPDTLNGVMSAAAKGAAAAILPNNVVQLYAGALNDVKTRLGSGQFITVLNGAFISNDAWKFVRVNEQMVFIHPSGRLHRHAIGTSDPSVELGGNPPKATCGAQVGDFLMVGDLRNDLDDGGGAFPSRVRWSGFNNIDAPWVSSVATQADFQDMPAEGGPVIAIMGREVGTIYQTRMISRATYRGPPNIFDFVTVEDKRGALARDAVVDIGAYQFFIAEDGFFMWNGTNATPIGDAKVNRYFFKKLAYGQRQRIVGAVDFVNGCVVWAFPTDSTGLLKELIIYSYRENKWSHAIQTLEYLFSSASSSITADELTLPVESYTTSFDAETYKLGGRARLAGFNSAHAYGLFTGAAMAATIDTAEFSGPDHRRVWAAGARPNVDLVFPQATLQVAGRDQMIGEPPAFTTAVFQEIDGSCPILADARYMRFRLNLPAGALWQHAVGIDIMRKAGGQF